MLPLPFVNLDPGNLSTIYTSLLFAVEHCKKNNHPFCMVTFDQPLYAKAMDIVLATGTNNPISKVIVRLGGFHLLISFMGAVGTIMAGRGIEEIWETVYAPNAVVHMLTGHAYARGLRAHFLTQLAVAIILFECMCITPDVKSGMLSLHDAVLNGELHITDVEQNEYVNTMLNAVD